MINTSIAIKTSEQVIVAVGNLKNHVVTPIVIQRVTFQAQL
jgi:hypothetical protein